MAGSGAVAPEVAGPLQLMITVTTPPPGGFVSREQLRQIVDDTKSRALRALDTHYGGDHWCSEIRTHASQEGPEATFILIVDDRRTGDSQARLVERVEAQFRRCWASAPGT